ncbi:MULTISPECIES: hypothetical protein [Paenibacillus]|uniref:hypothetical protein n=1 Tax=Paenibacillus TaxID=44249 RepID=UPI0022B8EAFD|nr:hypothetical protein [Paenibacillus caseinilyticus]MCZ8520026.1 hypothetical protein [Paenibacillus caseinilyticus]
MLKNKSLLYGLGIGLIAGTLMLQLMNTVAHPQTTMPETAAGQLDKAQIKELALQHFQVYEKDQAVYDQAKVDQIVQQKVAEEQQKLAAQQPAPAAGAGAVKEVYVYVAPGIVVSQVGDMLVASGVIPDKTAFLTEMNNRQLNEKVKIGVHAFKGTLTLEQVLAIVTGQ